MKKGYYIVPDIGVKEKGILNKIDCHVELMSRQTNVRKLVVKTNKFFSKVVYRLPFGNAGGDYKAVLKEIDRPDFLYIRKKSVDGRLIYFLKKIKLKFPSCKILFEIPTFPYDKDALSKPQNFFILKKDRYFRKKLVNYVDRIVTYSTDDEIFGIKTIKAHNGVDCAKIKTISNYDLNPYELRLIGVAQFRAQHGYERIIEGLSIYYKKNPQRLVKLTLVGGGLEYQYYKDLVEKYGMADHVRFTGSQSGEKLDELYNEADIAVSSLGLYKLGIDYLSTLKDCEYLAKGLPIILGYQNYALEGNPYSLYVSNDGTPINIDEVVQFYDKIFATGKKNVVDKIRCIAEQRADIKDTYSDVMKYILE